jgi:ribonuclease HI
VDSGKVLLSGRVYETTHQRMELTAALEAIRYVSGLESGSRKIFLYTDSQYLADLPRRRNRLLADGLKTKTNRSTANADLLLQLFQFLDSHLMQFVKVQSHQKENGLVNYNREVDKCSRKVVRDTVRNGPDKG